MGNITQCCASQSQCENVGFRTWAAVLHHTCTHTSSLSPRNLKSADYCVSLPFVFLLLVKVWSRSASLKLPQDLSSMLPSTCCILYKYFFNFHLFLQCCLLSLQKNIPLIIKGLNLEVNCWQPFCFARERRGK